jgi:hypothetical protein
LKISDGDISPLVFQLSVKNEPGEITLDKEMLAVVRELDGRKAVSTIAKNTGLGLDKLREIIEKLFKLEIIALVNQPIPILKEDFFVYLADQLSSATGPMAEVLIDEAVTSLGFTQSSFPRHRVQELVDLLIPKIFREEKRAAFKENLYRKISSKEV